MPRQGIIFYLESMRISTVTILFIILFSGPLFSAAQQINYDTLHDGRVIMEKDARIDTLISKTKEYNDGLARRKLQENGFRLMLLSTSDRNKVTQLRARLLQLYPDQKLYTLFQSPYIKVKFGNFHDKEQAKKMRDELVSKHLVEGNIYIVPEKIEVIPDKDGTAKDSSATKTKSKQKLK